MTEGRRLLVVGASGHAKVVLATAMAAGWEPAGLLDDDPQKQGRDVLGVRVIGTTADARKVDADAAVLAIGNSATRRELSRRLGLPWGTVVHPQAVIHPTVQLGEGTVVFAGVVVQPDVSIGRHVILNTGATVDHDCVVGAFAHLAPGSHLAGNVTVGEGGFLGIGVVAIPGVRIGEWTTVGAGGVVVRDLPAEVTAVGVPARPELMQS